MVTTSGRNVLVTGGARGLGKQFVEELVTAGYAVWFTSRDVDAISDVENEFKNLGGSCTGIFWDPLADKAANNLVKRIAEMGFEVEILINNVGHTMEVVSPTAPIEDFERVMRLNFLVHVDVTSGLLPNMRESGWGRIVNITSIAGLEVSGPAAFNAAKAALTAYTRSVGRLMAIESPGIVMSAVAPGIVVTPGGHWDILAQSNPEHVDSYIAQRTALGRFGEMHEISGIVAFLVSDRASFFHGSIIQVDGGQSRGYFSHTFLEGM